MIPLAAAGLRLKTGSAFRTRTPFKSTGTATDYAASNSSDSDALGSMAGPG